MSRSTRSSAAGGRDLALLLLVAGVFLVLAGFAAVLVIGVAVSTVIAGGPLSFPPLHGWAATAATVLIHADDPGAAIEQPWSAALAGAPVLYWLTTTAVLLLVATPTALASRVVWRRWGPTQPGHASRHEIRAELSLAAARRTAAWTRPSLTAPERRRAPLAEVAAPLHRGPGGMAMCSPLENPTGTLAPTQTGKTRRDLVHKTINAPGALLCSTTKPDLLEFAALARTRRGRPGPVMVFDTTGECAWPAQVRWSPISGCTDLATAYRRAHTMVEAAAVAVEAGGAGVGNDRVFRERATFVLAAYLLAAALHERTVESLVRWAISKPLDLEPVALLMRDFPQLAGNLRAEIGMVARTADAVWMSVRRVVEPWLNPQLRELCIPGPGQAFDARTFIGDRGSVFVIAGQHQAAAAAPLLTAFAEYWLTTAQEMALSYPNRRLDPPATAVLDELPNATPMPQLPSIISDSAGRGVLIHWAAQSLAQLEATFGAPGARQLLDNTTTMSIWGALKDAHALEWVSTLAGHHDRTRLQIQNDAILSPGRSSIGTETVPTYRPGDVRTLRRGSLIVVHRSLRPIVATTVDVSDRTDWPQLRDDVRAIRTRDVPIDTDGYQLEAGSR